MIRLAVLLGVMQRCRVEAFRRKFCSAAQPKRNDRSGTNAFVAGSALRHAALLGATSSPTGKMRFH